MFPVDCQANSITTQHTRELCRLSVRLPKFFARSFLRCGILNVSEPLTVLFCFFRDSARCLRGMFSASMCFFDLCGCQFIPLSSRGTACAVIGILFFCGRNLARCACDPMVLTRQEREANYPEKGEKRETCTLVRMKQARQNSLSLVTSWRTFAIATLSGGTVQPASRFVS